MACYRIYLTLRKSLPHSFAIAQRLPGSGRI